MVNARNYREIKHLFRKYRGIDIDIFSKYRTTRINVNTRVVHYCRLKLKNFLDALQESNAQNYAEPRKKGMRSPDCGDL